MIPVDDMQMEYVGSSGSVYDLEVLEFSSGGGLDIIFGEIPSGNIDGANATFTSLSPFIPEKLIVERNGITQRRGTDYNTSGNNTINLTFSPEAGESILINYIKL